MSSSSYLGGNEASDPIDYTPTQQELAGQHIANETPTLNISATIPQKLATQSKYFKNTSPMEKSFEISDLQQDQRPAYEEDIVQPKLQLEAKINDIQEQIETIKAENEKAWNNLITFILSNKKITENSTKISELNTTLKEIRSQLEGKESSLKEAMSIMGQDPEKTAAHFEALKTNNEANQSFLRPTEERFVENGVSGIGEMERRAKETMEKDKQQQHLMEQEKSKDLLIKYILDSLPEDHILKQQDSIDKITRMLVPDITSLDTQITSNSIKSNILRNTLLPSLVSSLENVNESSFKVINQITEGKDSEKALKDLRYKYSQTYGPGSFLLDAPETVLKASILPTLKILYTREFIKTSRSVRLNLTSRELQDDFEVWLTINKFPTSSYNRKFNSFDNFMLDKE